MAVLFAEYQHQALAQFQVLGDQVNARDDKLEAVIAGIKPMLNCVGFKPPEAS